jgi:2'-5' RNA ligase
MAFALGQTAIIIPVGAAEPIVGRWRRHFDPAAAAGVRPHVTIIYPFLAQQDINEEVMGDLRRLIAHHPSFTVTFAQCGHFPDVLFLVSDPDDPFRHLTAELVRAGQKPHPMPG